MKHIKPYKIFENNQEPQHPGFPKTEEEIHRLCEKYDITNYTINDDLSIGVDGDVYINNIGLEFIPLRFRYVSGDFDCRDNNLITLKGSPEKVDGHFYCHVNQLTTLEWSPEKVGKNFACTYNILNSLKGSPKEVGNSFYCGGNKLTTLKNIPEQLGADFNCASNPIYSIVNTFIEKDNSNELIEEFNDYDIVRGDKVVLNRLKAFINDFDLEMPNMVEVRKHYKIV